MSEVVALVDKNRQGTNITANVPIVDVLDNIHVELRLNLQDNHSPASMNVFQSDDGGSTWSHVAGLTWGGGHVPFDDEVGQYLQPSLGFSGSQYNGKLLRAEVSNLDPLKYQVVFKL